MKYFAEKVADGVISLENMSYQRLEELLEILTSWEDKELVQDELFYRHANKYRNFEQLRGIK